MKKVIIFLWLLIGSLQTIVPCYVGISGPYRYHNFSDFFTPDRSRYNRDFLYALDRFNDRCQGACTHYYEDEESRHKREVLALLEALRQREEEIIAQNKSSSEVGQLGGTF